MKKSEKKRDMLLIGGLLLAVFLALGLKFLLRQEGAALVVRVNGSEVARYALREAGKNPIHRPDHYLPAQPAHRDGHRGGRRRGPGLLKGWVR